MHVLNSYARHFGQCTAGWKPAPLPLQIHTYPCCHVLQLDFRGRGAGFQPAVESSTDWMSRKKGRAPCDARPLGIYVSEQR